MSKKYVLTEEIENNLFEMLKDGVPTLTIREEIKIRLGCGNTKAYEIINEISKKLPLLKVPFVNDLACTDYVRHTLKMEGFTRKILPVVPLTEDELERKSIISQLVSTGPTTRSEMLKLEDGKNNQFITCENNTPKWNEGIEEHANYTYNKYSDVYVISSKKVKSGWVVLPGTIVRAIRHAYANDTSANDISIKYSIPLDVLNDVLSKLSIKHNSIEFTDEELKTSTDEELVNKSLENRKFELQQKIEKASWKQTQEDALKWNTFKSGQFDVFENVLNKWNAPKQSCTTPTTSNITGDKVFVVALSDLHFGSAANANYIFGNKGWTTKDTVAAVAKYAQDITKQVMSRNYKFKKVVILGLGDLIHSMNGKTARGTELSYDVVREEQLDYAMDSITAFVQAMVDLFGTVEVHSIAGNHFYEVEMAMFKGIAKYFSANKCVSFTHYSTRPAAFKVDATLFIIDHGADAIEKSYVPNGAKREPYILNILAKHPELLVGVKSRLFCQGDKHHWENIEYGNFEFIMFSTILGVDQHAATNNWSNRARQSCLVLDDDGLKEIIHCYFD